MLDFINQFVEFIQNIIQMIKDLVADIRAKNDER